MCSVASPGIFRSASRVSPREIGRKTKSLPAKRSMICFCTCFSSARPGRAQVAQKLISTTLPFSDAMSTVLPSNIFTVEIGNGDADLYQRFTFRYCGLSLGQLKQFVPEVQSRFRRMPPRPGYPSTCRFVRMLMLPQTPAGQRKERKLICTESFIAVVGRWLGVNLSIRTGCGFTHFSPRCRSVPRRRFCTNSPACPCRTPRWADRSLCTW